MSLPIFQHRICKSFHTISQIDFKIFQKEQLGLYEYRHDLSQTTNIGYIAQIKAYVQAKLIFTCRQTKHNNSTAQKGAYLSAIQAGYELLDIDVEKDTSLFHCVKNKAIEQQLIVSKHYFKAMPSDRDIATDISEMQRLDTEYIKLAFWVDTINDLQRLRQWQTERQDIIFVAMGNYALRYRAWSLAHTATPFTYAALTPQQATVSQQPDYKMLIKEYKKILGDPFFLATLIGKTVQHSQSPILFATYTQTHGIANAYYHKSNLSSAADIPSIMQSYHAFNITAPYKQAIIPFLDSISPAAQAIGAVNTAYLKHGKWHGENTDHIGIHNSIAPYLPNINKALIIGAGGAARAAAYALQKQQIRTDIINRTLAKAQTVATQFAATAIEDLYNVNHYQLIINTSPVLLPHLKPTLPHYQGLVLEAIYPQSVIAPFLQNKLAKLIKGEVWLKAQGVAAFNCFFGDKA